MKLAVMQPYFFPYIGYWQLIQAVDKFIAYDDVNYIMRGWVNRNRILINGVPAWITIPLQQATQNKRICETVLQKSAWRDKLLRTLEVTYRRSPHFADFFPVLKRVICFPVANLAEYLVNQLRVVSAYLGIRTEITVSNHRYGNHALSGQSRILDICQQEGADTYVNLPGGRALYDESVFSEKGVHLRFLEPVFVAYSQQCPVFTPGMSLVDILMREGVDEVKRVHLASYSLSG
ncbi:MAG: WbqC family protein [Burkholderiaceae bacterium]|jgi:hypothetical protein|nr:WbqC family protein [Burkholderiaceae bacterium]